MSWTAAMKRSMCCVRQKWVTRHLEGLLWNSKNSFAGNWISNDIKWKWSRESVPFLREPHFPQSHWDTKATREGSKGRAYGNKWRIRGNHISLCFMKRYGCLMRSRVSDMLLVCRTHRGGFSTLFSRLVRVVTVALAMGAAKGGKVRKIRRAHDWQGAPPQTSKKLLLIFD